MAFSEEDLKRAMGALTPMERQELDRILQWDKVKAAQPVPQDFLDPARTFKEQRNYITDSARLKVLFCTRRAAKSFSFGLECFEDGKNWPKGNYLFLGLVREEAKRIFWKDVLKEIDHEWKVGANFNESSLTCTLPNGATIYIGAADANEQEWRKLLGQKYRKVFIDEAQDWKLDLHELVFSTLKPATTDHQGSITLAGTPGRARVGLFHDITRNSKAGVFKPTAVSGGWSVHTWTTFENTARMPTGRTMAEQWKLDIDELKAKHPRIEETPAFRRNYLGEWVIEDDALVYKYNPAKNDWDGTLPVYTRGRWHRVLGVDLGYNDDTAFVDMAYHDFDPNLYMLSVKKEKGLDISSVATRIKTYTEREITVIDGSNKQAVMEMQNRHDLSLWPADKTGKPDFIELMNADLIMERVKVDPVKCAPLIDEWAGLVWNDKTTKREEHPACPNHGADAALYGWRYCYQYISKPLPVAAEAGTKEWYEAEAEKMLKQTMAEMERKKFSDDNIFGPALEAFDWR